MERPFISTAAPYMASQSGTNRACAGCSLTKVKCVPNPDGNGACQRCQRLHKPCEPATPKVRSQIRKRKPRAMSPASQPIVERLEQKLDSLVSLIESTHDGVSKPRNAPSAFDHVISPTTTAQSLGQSPQNMEPLTTGTAAGLSSSSELHYSDLILSNTFMPNFAGANALLDIFKRQMSPRFPFITVPETTSAEELYRDKPLLYISIVAIASRDSAQQKGLGDLFTQDFTRRMFANCERSLDLLLGILTYAGWCYNNLWNVPQFTSLICAAMTLVCDLGLSQPIPKQATRKSPFDEALRATCAQSYRPPMKVTRTLEEQRAFLGCFFLSSVASLSFRKIHSYIKHSAHVDECVRYVEEFGDYQHDRSAVAMVKLQIITERIYQSPWHSNVELFNLDPGTIFLVDTLQQELKRFVENLLPEQANDPMILMHYHVAEIAIFEAGTHRSHLAADVIPNFKRLELLSACLRACTSYFTTFFSIPVAEYVTMSLPTWSRLTHSLAILHFLSEFESPGWSLDYVRETIDFVTVLNQVSERLDSVNKLVGYENFDTFSPTAKRLKRIKLYVEGKLDSELASSKDQELNTPLDSGMIPRTDELSTFFQYLDDNWMGDMLGPPDPGLAMHFSI